MEISRQDIKLYRYRNKLSRKGQLLRLIWGIVQWCLFRPTPRILFHHWRIFLLRLFGAKIGRGCKVSPSVRIWAPWMLTMGDLVCLGPGVDCYCVSPVRIGSRVTISQRAFLCTATHDISDPLRPLVHEAIIIMDQAWVFAEAFIGPGVSIGEGAVVGARAVVVKDVESWNVVAGNPARFIKHREFRQPSTQPYASSEGGA